MNPTELQCRIMDYLSRRSAVRMSTIPVHYRPTIHRMCDRDWKGPRWIERYDVVLVRLTAEGRAIAAAYRHGRTSVAPMGQQDLEVGA